MPTSDMRLADPKRIRAKRPKHQVRWPPPEHARFKSIWYTVKDGDTWLSVARKHGLNRAGWPDAPMALGDASLEQQRLENVRIFLIYHNFETFDSDEVNWCLHNYVGCQYTTDGVNYCFSSADKPGRISVPQLDEILKAPPPTPPKTHLLLLITRWHRRSTDIKSGRHYLNRLLSAVHLRAKREAHLLDMPQFCKEMREEYTALGEALVENPGKLRKEWNKINRKLKKSTRKFIVAELAEPLACLVYDWLRSGGAGKVTEARSVLYWAFADGIASALDPHYRAFSHKDKLRRKFFTLGRRKARGLNALERYQLAMALIQEYRVSGLAGDRPLIRDTLEHFQQAFHGGTFSGGVEHALNTPTYSWR